MAQTASATYKTNAAKAIRVPVFQLQVAWGRTADTFPTDWTTQAVDESTRIKSVSWTRQLDMKGPLAQGASPVAAMTIELNNYDNRYSPFNTSSPIHSLLLASTTTAGGLAVDYPKLWQVPVRVRVGWESEIERLTVFTGLIDEPDESWGVNGSSVSFRCFDVGGMLLKRKFSTELKTLVNVHDWIIHLLQIAGAGGTIGGNLDEGLFYIPYAWLDDEDIYSECARAAASEGGYFYFNEVGKAVFRNAAWWAQKADSLTSVYTFTVAKFTDITPGYDWKSVATGAIVEYQGRQPAGEQVVWKSSNVIVCAPSIDGDVPGLTEIEARLEYPVSLLYPFTLTVDWVPINAGGRDMSEVVEWRFVYSAQRASIQFLNASHETAFISRAQMRGVALFGGPTEQVRRNVSAPLVPENVMRLSDNAYIQTKAQADLVADLAADRMQYPRLTYKINGAPAVPWLQLGDRITITATEPITNSRDAIITKLDFSWRPDARFTMSIEAVDAAGLFQYEDFFVIGTHDYNDSAEVIFR